MSKEVDSDVIELLKGLQKQIIYLEKKVDTLISQSSHNSSGEKRYSQSSRPSYAGSSQKRYKDKHESPYKARSTQSSQGYDSKRRNEERIVPKKRKPYEPATQKRTKKN